MNDSATFTPDGRRDLQALETRFALRVAARLTQASAALPHDLTGRLRFARERALEQARQSAARPVLPVHQVGGASLALGGPGSGEPSWWWRLASLLPLLALVSGLVLIQQSNDTEQIQLAAEIDAALLADDLPPSAYTDAGFAEFLRLPPD